MGKHYKCPANCGKIFITEHHANKHAEKEHPSSEPGKELSKGWRTPHGFIDFSYPVSYEYACNALKQMSNEIEETKLRKEESIKQLTQMKVRSDDNT